MPDRDLAARRSLAVTGEELQRIVLDIHDGPVQNLFAALSQLTVLRTRLAAQPQYMLVAPPTINGRTMFKPSCVNSRLKRSE